LIGTLRVWVGIPDDVVLIPFNTAERKVLGVATPLASQNQVSTIYPPVANAFGLNPVMTGYVNSIYVQASAPETVGAAIAQVTHIVAGVVLSFVISAVPLAHARLAGRGAGRLPLLGGRGNFLRLLPGP
jgi:hypothetical protein